MPGEDKDFMTITGCQSSFVAFEVHAPSAVFSCYGPRRVTKLDTFMALIVNSCKIPEPKRQNGKRLEVILWGQF